MVVGGNVDFTYGSLDLSFLNETNSYRYGSSPSVHLHTKDNLVHLDTANPYSVGGLFEHFFVYVLLGNINSGEPRMISPNDEL